MKAAIMVPGADGGRWDVRDVQRPVVTAGHVLVRVYASSLNRAEFRRLHTLRIRPGQTVPEARTGNHERGLHAFLQLPGTPTGGRMRHSP